MRMPASILSMALALLPLYAQPLLAQPPASDYRVQLRLRSQAAPEQKLVQIRQILNDLRAVGFKTDAPDEDILQPDRLTLEGTIPAAAADAVLRDPRFRGALLIPVGMMLQSDGPALARVSLRLHGGLERQVQQKLASEVSALLSKIGFKEAIGYDDRDRTRLVGTLPVSQLDSLLEDLRWQESGWLAPRQAVETLPEPLRSGWPVYSATVMGPAIAEPVPAGQAPDPFDGKVAKSLLPLLSQQEPRRLEILLRAAPNPDARGWSNMLVRTAPSMVLEGILGNLVTARVSPQDVKAIASLPWVSTIRLAQAAVPQRDRGDARSDASVIALQTPGTGKGARIALIDSDFALAESVKGSLLPQQTKILDLTAGLREDLLPASSGSVMGEGTSRAISLARIAPEAELTLIRVDPETPFVLLDIARFINGEAKTPIFLQQRADELEQEETALDKERDRLSQQRKKVLDDFNQDPKTNALRADYFKQQAELERRDSLLRSRQKRYLGLLNSLRALKGTQIVASNLVWPDGHPVDGSGGLSRALGERAFGAALWAQAAGATRGQAWHDLFRDEDGNTVLEFVPLSSPKRAGKWSAELDFLGWQANEVTPASELPPGKYRVSAQWREKQDPALFNDPVDHYRKPLAEIRLQVLEQVDPTGTKEPVDTMKLKVVSDQAPQRLDSKPGSALYEVTVEFVVEKPGRYALRVEATKPHGIEPKGVASVPGGKSDWELRPRILVRELEGKVRGRPVFLDYFTEVGSLGSPADSRGVLSVSAVDEMGRPRASSPAGAAMGQELLPKPELKAQAAQGDEIGAAAVAAGILARKLGQAAGPVELERMLRLRPGLWLQ